MEEECGGECSCNLLSMSQKSQNWRRAALSYTYHGIRALLDARRLGVGEKKDELSVITQARVLHRPRKKRQARASSD